MGRPTIADVAEAAGVSVSTVDRVLSGREKVRRVTAERVLAAAERIGFYAAPAIKHRLGADKPVRTLGFLLQQHTRPFYRNLAQTLTDAAQHNLNARIHTKVEFLENLSPDNVANHILQLGSQVDALAVVAAEHPRVAQAIENLRANGVPTFALISGLTTAGGTGYVGLDNWKVGRTSAWTFANMCPQPGKIGIIVGSHRYRCQEMNEIGFRSYFREHAPEFQLLEPMISAEDRRVAAELTRDLLIREPDLSGLYISGGGITGVLTALRESDKAQQMVVVGYELMEETRAALVDGILNLVISHPLPRLAEVAVESMLEAIGEERSDNLPVRLLPFEIYTPENL
ncbi:MAG: LacI family DNA-binding transcriptional regulator [Thiolinea sp.]